jgi:hypothetical protein
VASFPGKRRAHKGVEGIRGGEVWVETGGESRVGRRGKKSKLWNGASLESGSEQLVR